MTAVTDARSFAGLLSELLEAKPNNATVRVLLTTAHTHLWSLIDELDGPVVDCEIVDDVLMCALPQDCPLGPQPHPFTAPGPDESVMYCCRQPWEVGPVRKPGDEPAPRPVAWLIPRADEPGPAAEPVPACPLPPYEPDPREQCTANNDGWGCNASAGHEPLDHATRDSKSGDLVSRWPVTPTPAVIGLDVVFVGAHQPPDVAKITARVDDDTVEVTWPGGGRTADQLDDLRPWPLTPPVDADQVPFRHQPGEGM